MSNSVDSEQIGDMVVMRGLNYGLEEIAEEVGVSRQTVSRRLEGVREDADKTDELEGLIVMEWVLQSGKTPVGDNGESE